jgi:chorismate mutase-like protein
VASTLPVEGDAGETLARFRAELNDLDERIVRLLGRRFEVIRAIGQHKRRNEIPMMQPARVLEVKERCARIASAHGVDPEFARRLFALIIDEACRVEDGIIDGAQTGA